jgi:dethiobiotin synthetase
MNTPIFITGIGTDVGKTLVSAIVTEALNADYWKPVQAGYADGTDAELIKGLLTNTHSVIHPELHKLSTPASPHIAARKEGITINTAQIVNQAELILESIGEKSLVIEGAGGLLVPLADGLMVAELIAQLKARVILVSRNYLGSINHSLLTAAYCRNHGLDVIGWIFNDDYLSYEDEIVKWSGYPSIGSITKLEHINKASVHTQAIRIQSSLIAHLNAST